MLQCDYFYYPDMTTFTLSLHNLCIVLRYYDAHWVPCSWSYTDTHVPRKLSTTSALDFDSRNTLAPHIPHPRPNTATMEHRSTRRHTPSNSAADTGDYDPHTLPPKSSILYSTHDNNLTSVLPTVPDTLRDDAYDEFTPCWLTSVIGPLPTGEVRSLIRRSKWWYLPHSGTGPKASNEG